MLLSLGRMQGPSAMTPELDTGHLLELYQALSIPVSLATTAERTQSSTIRLPVQLGPTELPHKAP